MKNGNFDNNTVNIKSSTDCEKNCILSLRRVPQSKLNFWTLQIYNTYGRRSNKWTTYIWSIWTVQIDSSLTDHLCYDSLNRPNLSFGYWHVCSCQSFNPFTSRGQTVREVVSALVITDIVIFIESAHWADSIIESRCPYVCVSVCLCVPFPCDFLASS